MIKTIICALDFQSDYEYVLDWATKMVKQYNASLIILFTYRLTPSQGTEDVHLRREKIEKEAKERFAEIEKKLIDNKIFTYTFLVEVGFLSDRILSHASRNENSMLILGQEVAQMIHKNDEKGFTFYLEQLNIPTIVLPKAYAEV